MSWEKATKQEGEEALLEMIKAGTVETRPHPTLPANSAIKLAKNLQVAFEEDVWSSMKKHSTGTSSLSSQALRSANTLCLRV